MFYEYMISSDFLPGSFIMDPVTLLLSWWHKLDNKTALFNLIVCSIFFFFFCVLHFLKLPRKGNLNLPPSPPKLPIIGNLHQIDKLLHRSLQAHSMKYGPLMLLHLGSSPVLVVSSAEIAEEIVRTHDIVFSDRPRSKATEALFFGSCDVGFGEMGDYWRQIKKIFVVQLLSQKRVWEFQFVRIEETAKMVEKISLSCINGAAVNLSKMLATISTDIILRCSVGRTYKGLEGYQSLGTLGRKVTDLLTAFCFEDLFPWLGWIDTLTGFTASLNRTSREINDFLDEVIEEHQVCKCDDQDDESSEKDFLDILLHLQQDTSADVNLTTEKIKAILLDVVLAGSESAAVTLEWMMAELMNSPSVMKKAQEEVRKVVGANSKVNETDMDKMKYLKLVIKETLRLHPPIALVPRQTSESTILRGHNIPPKTRVFINDWAIHRNPDFWEDPEEFRPERFENMEFDYKCSQYQYIPFGFGRRSCPGIPFANAEMEYVLATLLYCFDWKLPAAGGSGEHVDMTEAPGLVIHKKLPLLLVPLAVSP